MLTTRRYCAAIVSNYFCQLLYGKDRGKGAENGGKTLEVYKWTLCEALIESSESAVIIPW